MRLMQAGMIVFACALLSACANTGLRELDKPGEGPDEFRIVPGKPLQSPEDYASLPAPTPGEGNLTDQQPLNDSVAVLGGRRPAAGGAVPSRDGAIVNHASRFGRDGSIRTQLAAEDEDFRRRRGRFTNIRIVREDNYGKVYRNELLDPRAEQRRWRRAGARTPSAPPQ
jgi:hypothetical protein